MELFMESDFKERSEDERPETEAMPDTVTQTGTVPFPPHCPTCEQKGCDDVFKQSNYVCVPVKVKPFAKTGCASVTCHGDPVITPGNECDGQVDGCCEFTITQKLCISLPISFGADVKVSPTRVQCGDISSCQP